MSVSFSVIANAKKMIAEKNYQYISVDYSYFKECCYNSYLAIYFSLIYMIDFCGIEFSGSSDIRENLSILRKIVDYIPYEIELYYLAPILNSWAINYKSESQIKASIVDIDLSLKIANELVSRCELLEKSK